MKDQQLERRVILSRHPRNSLTLPCDAKVICANAAVAHQIGVPPCTLEDFARDVLAGALVHVASGDVARRYLREAIADLTGHADPGGLSQSMASAVNLLYRSGADLEVLALKGSDRVRFVAQLAINARRKLRELSLVAGADAIGAATALVTSPNPIVVFGFHRLGVGDVAFIDAVASAGSLVYLPFCAESQLFEENCAASEAFAARGWTVETPEDSPALVGQSCVDSFLGIGSVTGAARVWSFPSPEEEVRGVLSQVKADIVDGAYAAGGFQWFWIGSHADYDHLPG